MNNNINKTFNITKLLSILGIFKAKTGGQCRRAHLAAGLTAQPPAERSVGNERMTNYGTCTAFSKPLIYTALSVTNVYTIVMYGAATLSTTVSNGVGLRVNELRPSLAWAEVLRNATAAGAPYHFRSFILTQIACTN